MNNKAIVLEGDCPVFQKNWKDHARQAELRFVNLLTTHLKSRIDQAKAQLVEETEKNYVAQRSAKLPNAKVNLALKNTLEDAKQERKDALKTNKPKKDW